MIKRQLHLCLLLPIKKPQEKVIQRWAQSPKKPFLAKNAPKMPFSSPEGSVWQHIANPTPDSENSDFSTIMMWRWFFNFWPKSKKKIFAGKKCRFSLFVGICHLACLFYRLKLRYLHQTSGIRCENLISGGVYHLD